MNKKLTISIVVLLFVAIPLWIWLIAPQLTKLPKDFAYEAEVVSSDNFYDEANQQYSGEKRSVTKFSYGVIGEQEGVLIIKNIFDVRNLTGEPIFSVERLYGIEAITGKHVAGFGDKNRDGYLFAPKGLKKGAPFTYWHINYDGPAHMQFVGEETISGLTVYRYQTHYEGVVIDQTKNLGFLPEVGVTRGINLDPYLQLWIEPQTGTLINYKDETTAYYYDLEAGKRLYPWNKFSNTFKQSSITTQVEIAKQKKLFIFVINLGVLIAIILIAFITILVWSLWRLYMAKKDTVKNLKKLEENQIKLKEEQVKLKDAITTVSLQNVQLEKTKTAILNVLEDLNIQEQKLTEAKAKDEALLQGIGDGVIATDAEGKIILMNQAAQEMIGWHSENMMGRLFYDVVTIEDEKGNVVPREKRPVYLALAGTTTTTTTTTTGPTYHYVRKDKTKFPIAIKATPVVVDNKIIGAIEVFRDITKEKEIDKAKTEFVSLASHQLKTPPTAIKLLTERILAGRVGTFTKKQKEYLNDISFSNQRIIDIVNTLLSVSRIEMGTFAVKTEKKDVITIIKNVLSELSPLIKSKELQLKERYPKKSVVLPIDESLLNMAISNLVTNAINYTSPQATVQVECKEVLRGQTLQDKVLQEDCFVIIVSDTGCGIPQNQQSKIFDKFFRADNAREKYPGGTGLGLYIVKSILDNSGGKMWFESEENKGTTFYVAIPMTGMKSKAGNKNLISHSI